MNAKSAVAIFMILLAALIVSCSMQSYEDLEAEFKITGDSTKLDVRDAQMERAEQFFLVKFACLESDKHTWFCANMHRSNRIRPRTPRTIDETIQQYQKERADRCQCVVN